MSSAASGSALERRAPFRFGRLTKEEVVRAVEQLQDAIEAERAKEAQSEEQVATFNTALASYASHLGITFRDRQGRAGRGDGLP